MIAYIQGTIRDKALNYVIVENGGLGYQVFIAEGLLTELRKGQNAELYIHHHVREEVSDLYGFRSLEELEFFGALISVSGVGPKSALGVMSVASVDDIREAVARGDASLLTKVSGVGKKTAERLVFELKGKVGRLISGDSLLSNGVSLGDDLDALMSLGYSLVDAREALANIPPSISDSGERIKAALRSMGRGKIK
jgi:Holliday junction DNA helicase RuvA